MQNIKTQLKLFQDKYPENCILTELIKSTSNFYIIRVSVMFNGLARMNAHGCGETVEIAEDRAISRALNHLGFFIIPELENEQIISPEIITPKISSIPVLSEEQDIDKMIESSIKTHKQNQPKDLSDEIAQTHVQLERVGWTAKEGQEHLIKTYGKRARAMLTEEELIDFLNYLKSLPSASPAVPTI